MASRCVIATAPDLLPATGGGAFDPTSKTFAFGAIDSQQAVVEMLDLDHDFYLFADAETGLDAVVCRRDDGNIGLIHAAGAWPGACEALICETSHFSEPITLEPAVSEMNALSHRFLFFIDADTSRGNMIYIRYEGNYGLIQPAQ
jgi:Sigma 54 modulation/S30EA ribosomal protein C terminus